MWDRARLPLRRRRWARNREQAAAPYRKRDGLQISAGPAVVFGDFSGTNGISRAAIYDLEQLKHRHSEIIAIDIGDCIAGRGTQTPLFDPIENLYLFCQPDNYEHVLGLATPAALQNSYRVGRWVWETPLFPTSWKFAEHVVHEIWAPSEYCGAVFRQSMSVPVHIVPHAVPMPAPSPIDMRRRLGISDQAFVGLSIMDIRSCPMRKNPWAHVIAWQKAFGTSQSAVLILKIRTGKRTAIVAKELEELARPSKNILIISEDLSEAELGALQHACDVFLSLHRAEGYGLNIHEALLCGKPTLATHWSANKEYGPAFSNYRGIRSALVPYRDWTAHYEDRNFYWAEPDLDHAAAELQNLRDMSAR